MTDERMGPIPVDRRRSIRSTYRGAIEFPVVHRLDARV